MKRKVIIFTTVALFCFMGYSMLYNGFSGVKSINIQEYDNSFEDVNKTTDKEIVAEITGILNRSNKITKTRYELVSEPKYKIQLEYKDNNKEVLYFYEGFDNDETLITSDSSTNYYKINEKQTKKIFQLLLN
ncbi:MAG: hypothetical protein ACI35R_05895 [Bacillus sp. (in: firmicutes)]